MTQGRLDGVRAGAYRVGARGPGWHGESCGLGRGLPASLGVLAAKALSSPSDGTHYLVQSQVFQPVTDYYFTPIYTLEARL